MDAAEDDRSGSADLLPGPARDRLARALREAEQLRVDLAAARRAAWEAAAQSERMGRELAALRTQAQMALARNLRWPPQQDADLTVARS